MLDRYNQYHSSCAPSFRTCFGPLPAEWSGVTAAGTSLTSGVEQYPQSDTLDRPPSAPCLVGSIDRCVGLGVIKEVKVVAEEPDRPPSASGLERSPALGCEPLIIVSVNGYV